MLGALEAPLHYFCISLRVHFIICSWGFGGVPLLFLLLFFVHTYYLFIHIPIGYLLLFFLLFLRSRVSFHWDLLS